MLLLMKIWQLDVFASELFIEQNSGDFTYTLDILYYYQIYLISFNTSMYKNFYVLNITLFILINGPFNIWLFTII